MTVMNNATPRLKAEATGGASPAPAAPKTARPGQGGRRRKGKNTGLVVETAGIRHYISARTSQALYLHNYLRSHSVRSSYPEPACTGSDSIELARDIDVAAVQGLLDAWA
jgi:hypothetical protein